MKEDKLKESLDDLLKTMKEDSKELEFKIQHEKKVIKYRLLMTVLYNIFITIVTLKLFGLISWSWFKVLIPIYLICILMVVGIIEGVIIRKVFNNKNEVNNVLNNEEYKV